MEANILGINTHFTIEGEGETDCCPARLGGRI